MSTGRSEFECMLCIRDKINTQRLKGITYAHVIGNTEDFVGGALVEYSIAPLLKGKQRRSRAHTARFCKVEENESLKLKGVPYEMSSLSCPGQR
jgi:hypothetical protein